MNIPPFTNPRAYATPVLKAWRKEMLASPQVLRDNPRLQAITQELARREAAAKADKK